MTAPRSVTVRSPSWTLSFLPAGTPVLVSSGRVTVGGLGAVVVGGAVFGVGDWGGCVVRTGVGVTDGSGLVVGAGADVGGAVGLVVGVPVGGGVVPWGVGVMVGPVGGLHWRSGATDARGVRTGALPTGTPARES